MKRRGLCAALIALLALAIQPLVFADVLVGLIGYWPFDEGEGEVTVDEVGGHDGAIERATWTDQAIEGKALKFVPQDDTKVRVEDAKDLDELPDGLTVANWIRPLSRGGMMDKSGLADRIQWFLMEDGRLHWGAGPNFTFTDGPVVKFGEWSHVAWSHNPVEESVAYVNGEEVHNQKGLGKFLPTGEPMYFGDMGVLPGNNPKQQNFEGIIDEIGFWNRPLSAKEVKEVFDRGLNQILAVSAHGKLAMTWAAVKARI